MIERAYEIASLVHAGQKDKAGHDYIEHPLAVSRMLDTEEEKTVGLLHDTIEDGDGTIITLEGIREEFGDKIADAVEALTHREGEDYFDYLERVAKNRLAVRVKLADLTHNSDLSRIEHPTEKDYARIEKYKKAKRFLQGKEQDEESHPCIGFSMSDPLEAYRHMEMEKIIDYGDTCGDHYLHTWDDGRRLLMRCKNCGGYILVQLSEYHGFEEDSYYVDYFPVSGPKEAQEINEQYNGYRIENEFPERWLNGDSEDHPHWSR